MRPTIENDRAAGGDPPAVPISGDVDPFARTDRPVWSVTLWPYRSLDQKGFRSLMWFSAAAMTLPILALARTPAGLALAPYAGGAFFGLWLFMKLSYRSGRLTEELRLWPDMIAVERREPTGKVLRWHANPYWVQVDLTNTKTIEQYLTLKGAGRRIELGAFLTPDERVELAGEIRRRLIALGRPLVER